MFSRAQTRLFMILSLATALLLCFIGLNLNRDEAEYQSQALLEIPDEFRQQASAPSPAAVSAPRRPDPVRDVSATQESGEFRGALEDEGTEIILD